jgi:hypothetical protein
MSKMQSAYDKRKVQDKIVQFQNKRMLNQPSRMTIGSQGKRTNHVIMQRTQEIGSKHIPVFDYQPPQIVDFNTSSFDSLS